MRIRKEALDELIENEGELKTGPINTMGILRLALDLRDAREEALAHAALDSVSIERRKLHPNTVAARRMNGYAGSDAYNKGLDEAIAIINRANKKEVAT